MLKKQHINGIAWTTRDDVSRDLLEDLGMLLRQPTPEMGVPLIKDNNVRSAFFRESGDERYPQLFVKHFKKPGALQQIKLLFVPSKAAAEWRNLQALEHRGLPCPRPLAFFEQRRAGLPGAGCLVTERLVGAEPLNEFFVHAALKPQQQFQLTRQLAALTAAMHGGGVFFRDYHAGNIMIRESAAKGFEIFLIDLHRARVLGNLSSRMMISDLAQLGNSLPVSRSAGLRFLQAYCSLAQTELPSLSNFVRQISRKAGRLEARRILSRSKRCLKKSSVFEVACSGGERYCGRRDFGYAAAGSAVRAHCAGRDDGGPVVKKSSKSTLTTHAGGNGELLCVKGYRYRGIGYALKNLFRKSRALKSWIAANGLIVRGLQTPQPLAMIEKRQGPLTRESFFICRWLDGAQELNSYVRSTQWSPDLKNRFIRELAHTVRTLHARGIYHADLKSNNVLVKEQVGAWDFSFIDLDRVSFTRPLTFQRRANNLAQINASVADIMTIRDRLLFFRIYSRGTACYTERKRYYRRIIEIGRSKITAPYGVNFDDE